MKWITTDEGCHVQITNDGQIIKGAGNKKSYEYYKTVEHKVDSTTYARLSSLINTNRRKWVKGFNSQIIGNTEYFFYYKNFDKYVIIHERAYGGEFYD